MTKSVFTIHGRPYVKRLGFESTHVARQKIFDALNMPHTIIFSDPFIASPNWVERIHQVGQVQYKNPLLEQSDIALDTPSLTREEAMALLDNPIDVKDVQYTENNMVSSITLAEETVYFTSGIFMTKKDTIITLYNAKSEVCTIELEGAYWIMTYPDGHKKTNIEIMAEWLSEHSKTDDIFITDFSSDHPLALKKFFQNTNRQLYAVIHYNIFSSIMRFAFPRWCKLLVASEMLVEKLNMLDVTAQFLPPICVENVDKKNYEGLKRFCLVGSKYPVKRMEIAVNAFRELQDTDVHLTIYGGLAESVQQEDFPANITYVGHVKEVPYGEHDAYISCSQSECFANAMVEASSHGLACLVSNVDLAHKYYASIDTAVHLFEDEEDLKQKIKELSQQTAASATFAQQYMFDKVIQRYKEVFNIS